MWGPGIVLLIPFLQVLPWPPVCQCHSSIDRCSANGRPSCRSLEFSFPAAPSSRYTAQQIVAAWFFPDSSLFPPLSKTNGCGVSPSYATNWKLIPGGKMVQSAHLVGFCLFFFAQAWQSCLAAVQFWKPLFHTVICWFPSCLKQKGKFTLQSNILLARNRRFNPLAFKKCFL